MNKKLREIMNHYGINNQLKYFQSEVFELNEAIIKYQESLRNPIDVILNAFEPVIDFICKRPSVKKTDSIKEEIADVIDKAIMHINLNKQKTICAYGDNEDDDFEIELWEEDIDKLLDILKEV